MLRAVGGFDPLPSLSVQLIYRVRSSRFSAVACQKCCFSDPVERKQHFQPETAEEWLELTSYMSYMYDEGRGSPCPTTFSVRTTHISRYTQPFLSRFWPKKYYFRTQRFWPKTAKGRLDLTSCMSYMDAEGRGLPFLTALIIHTAHIARLV